MSKLNERKTAIEQLIESAQDSGAVGALIIYGDDATESGDLRAAALVDDASAVAMAYTRLSYIIASDMDITSSQVIARDADKCVKKFSLANGVELTLTVTTPDKTPADGWYRIAWDEMNAAALLSAGVPEDILCDLAPAPVEEPAAEAPAEDDMADDFDDMPEEETVVVAPVIIEKEEKEEPQPEPAAEPETTPENELEQYLEFVSRNLRNAQRAIASGQLIRAGEIVSVLRKMAIELICVRNGIDSNFEQSIDFIDCEEKRMLTRTYPRNMDQQNLVLALGTLSELFDRLI